MEVETAALEMGMEAATATLETGTPAKAALARAAMQAAAEAILLPAIPLLASLPAATLQGRAAGAAIRVPVVVR
jgi:hypothetical protein